MLYFKVIACLFGFSLLISCATTEQPVKPDLDKFFERKLKNIQVPNSDQIKEVALSTDYPHTTFDEVWEAIIKVLMQNGVILHLSKKAGIAVAISDMVPAAPVEKGQEEQVGFFKPLSPLFNTINLMVEENPQKDGAITVHLKADKPINKVLFDKLSTQVYADKKWKYLYK